jgi:glycosyltransferase involved in cell wall biosynthesis
MRIVIDGRGLQGNTTGAGNALGWLLERLRADAPQHEYVVLRPPAAYWRLRRQLWWEQVELPRQAARLRADVLHVPGGTSIPLVRRRRTVMTLHDLAPRAHPEWLPPGPGRWYWARWVTRTAALADCVLVPSEATRRDVLTLAGIPEHRVRVTPWGVPPDVARGVDARTAETVRRRHGLPERYLLYVGTVDRRKDYPTLLRALPLLRPGTSLVLAGTIIPGRTDFDEMLGALGLRPRVRVLGYVARADLPGLYAAAGAFVYPSLHEGFGIPVLEAMACGAPVVTYNTSALPEVAGDGAVLLDPPVSPETLATALRRVLEDTGFRRELVGRGRARARRFDWGATARATLDAYAGVPASACGS